MGQAELCRRSFVGFASLAAGAVTASKVLAAGEAPLAWPVKAYSRTSRWLGASDCCLR